MASTVSATGANPAARPRRQSKGPMSRLSARAPGCCATCRAVPTAANRWPSTRGPMSACRGKPAAWVLSALGEELREACPAEWDRAAVSHPFIQAVGDGSITDQQFNTWLMQDYLFVVEFTRFAGRVLAKAPDEAGMQLILRSLCVLPDELTWFRETLEARGFDVGAVEQQPALREYVAALEAWGASLGWAEALVAYFGIEHVYNSAWARCSGAPEPYQTWAQRWGSPEFSAFCWDLGSAAESALLAESGAEEVTPEQRERASELFREILRLEDGFWDMAFHTTPGPTDDTV